MVFTRFVFLAFFSIYYYSNTQSLKNKFWNIYSNSKWNFIDIKYLFDYFLGSLVKIEVWVRIEKTSDSSYYVIHAP